MSPLCGRMTTKADKGRKHIGGCVPQACLPEGRVYYEPTEIGNEKRVKERLDY
jgi:hypothetical protein